MLVGEFSKADIAQLRQASADPEAMEAIIVRLREIANLEGHSYGAVRLAAEALRALGADVPLCRSEQLRLARVEDKSLSLMP